MRGECCRKSCPVSVVLRSLAVFAALIIPGAAAADIKLPAIVGDNMVLQRESEAPIWGWESAGEKIRIEAEWREDAIETVANERGRWMARIPTPAAGGPYRITISGRTTVAIRNVMIGEVWLCSGQSNMEMPVGNAGGGYGGVDDAEGEIAAAKFPAMRLFTVKNTFAARARIDCQGEWLECSPETVRSFSAAGYFFGRELHEALDVPIGLISADWGGTVAEAWMSAGALREFPEFAESLDYLEEVNDPNERFQAVKRHRLRWWEALDERSGVSGSWQTVSFEDSEWKTMRLPATMSAGGLGSFDGIVLFRRKIDIPARLAAKDALLELGPIDDYDDAWVNGVPVGAVHEPGRWAQARRYAVPASALRAGENIVTVRVLDTGGPGGINGEPDQMALRWQEGDDSIALAGEWRYMVGSAVRELPPMPQGATLTRNTASVLYNGMIAPLIPFRIRGAVWYQGESNRERAERYRTLFPALIRSWRSEWQAGEFPFYYVQIAPFAYRGDRGETAALREAQLMALRTPNTGIVVTLDIGDRGDIHPRNKQEVGRRLALWALARTYRRREIVPSGPLYRSMAIEGSTVRLRFHHAGSGLRLKETRRSPFLIAGGDRRFAPARAVIDGDCVLLSSERVARPIAVRHAWEAAPEASLFNGEGLPASPFRTDSWRGALPPIDNSDEVARCRGDDPGLVPLFNGNDLSGWKNVNCAPSTWRVEDGMILCSGFPTGVLRTERQYENFVLELEWRHMEPLGNAGVFVWSGPLPVRGQPFTRSVEVQVMDGQEGDWFTSDGDIFPIHGATMTPENGRGGSRAFPTERRCNPSPLWNHYRITCIDGAVSLAVNGKVVTRGRSCRPRKGHICLESEGSPLQFRNLRIEELPSRIHLRREEEVPIERGFVPLYNGVDFSGWKHGAEHEGHWRVADWRVDFDGEGTDLWTERSYRDFVLVCDWRWSGEPVETERPVIRPDGAGELGAGGKALTRKVPDAGDSGIYLRGSSKSQVNIWCWPIGSGEVYGYRTDSSMPPEVRAAVTPKVVADAPIGDWNRFVITMRGDRLTVVLNGKTVIEQARLPGVPEAGPIALQRHGSPIQFANLYIKEIAEF